MTDKIWAELTKLGRITPEIPALFEEDLDRFTKFSAAQDDLLLDYSKTSLTAPALDLLLRLAETTQLEAKRDAMFRGAPVNNTERRAALHTALRDPGPAMVAVDGKDVLPEIHASLARLSAFATGIRAGEIKTSGGERFTDIINIGIGGSDLGPAMVTGALAPYHDGPRTHFVSNVDAAHLADTLKMLDPARTLIIIASKTFTTIETMTNAAAARRWISGALGEDAVPAHFAAVSSAVPKAEAFGIPAARVFGFADWVGGRYSVWSVIGLPVMLAIGAENFRAFLAGAHAMDRHFKAAPLAQNLPVLMGLIGVWHRNACGFGARAVLPYDQRLARLPAYLQQLDMESNGKSVKKDGTQAGRATGPLIFGEPGTNGQHAFYQWLHQGTDVTPAEFLIAAQGHEPELRNHHDLLVANCLAQSQALMQGRSILEAEALYARRDPAEISIMAPHRVFPGSRPSITLAYRKLDPETLGRLIALYEHRVFVEAALWDINPFDQWGVELGKELAGKLAPVVSGAEAPDAQDASTAGLVRHLRALL